MSRLTRFADRINNVQYFFAERSVRLALGFLVLTLIILIVIATQYPGRFLTLFLDSLLTVLFGLITLFFSYDLLLKYGKGAESDRIGEDQTVIQRYRDRVDLMERKSAPGWTSHFESKQPKNLPFVAEYVPDSPRQVDSYDVNIEDEVYSIPDRLNLILQPVETEQRERFQSEGHYNSLKAGLTSIEDGSLHFRPESYFQSFRTIHSPDYEIYQGRSLRDLTDWMLFEENRLKPLCESPYPNAFGGGGLVLTKDGRAVIPIRSSEVAYATGEAEVSYGGSLDLSELEATKSMSEHYNKEIKEELGIRPDQVVDTHCLGIVRRLELLGSPDMLILTIVDDEVEFENTSRENIRLVRIDVLPEYSDLTLDDILDPTVTGTIVESIFNRLDDEGYLPGSALAATLVLLAQHAEEA